MNFLQSVFLGLVQGITEFLPVSSSGHLMIFEQLMHFEGDIEFFNVFLHVGTLFAIMIGMQRDIVKLFKAFVAMAKDCFYNIRLAFNGETNIVKNDFAFTPDERIFILTGPNRGGKTIIEQGLGLTSVMMSLGLFVTADKCSGLPFRNILTHFPIDENLTINYGRLGEEAVRIKNIVKASGENTLILFNETFSTTSASDGLYLSKDLIRVLKEKGSYVIFNTHIHELAREIPEMNKWDGRGDITSLVMERKDEKNTFILKRAEPDSSSYARDIAEKYGITYEQMTDKD